ncbi:hypothetical protein KM043_009140 [Ampulex compressa]|nr:hypothetical protein KM043_009140 [Ampulex compressa]
MYRGHAYPAIGFCLVITEFIKQRGRTFFPGNLVIVPVPFLRRVSTKLVARPIETLVVRADRYPSPPTDSSVNAYRCSSHKFRAVSILCREKILSTACKFRQDPKASLDSDGFPARAKAGPTPLKLAYAR